MLRRHSTKTLHACIWFAGSAAIFGCGSGVAGGQKNDDAAPDDGWSFRADYVSPACNAAGKCGKLVDERDGKTYRTVNIGKQTWMAEALNYGERRDHDAPAGDGTTPSKVCPLDDEVWCARVGAAYAWHEMMALPATCETEDCSMLIAAPARGLCPSGFHVPSARELDELLTAVDGASASGCNSATALRATSGWQYENVAASASDSSGMSVFPQALVKSAGTYFGTSVALWASDSFSQRFHVLEISIGSACATLLDFSSVASRTESVRCVAD